MKRRTKIATIVTAGLLSAALVGVGFAAWQIGGGTQTQQVTGNVTVEQATDNALVADDFKLDATTHNIVYGSLENENGSWLTNETKEVLSFDIQITITEKVGSISIAFSADEGWTTAKTANYVVDPVFTLEDENYEISGSNIQLKATKSATASTLTLHVEFKWGSAFGGKNPSEYYGALDINEKHDEAKTALNAMYDALDGVSYTITLVASAA